MVEFEPHLQKSHHVGRPKSETQTLEKNTDKILIEIVSAELTHKAGEKHNVYCLVKDHDEQRNVFHQTSIIRQNNDPIWTVKTKSLFVMDADKLDVNRGMVDFELIHKDLKFLLEKKLGSVTLRWKQILHGDGSRVEHKLYNGNGKKSSGSSNLCTGILALRYRRPEPNELRFMNELNASSTRAPSITSLATVPKAFVGRMSMVSAPQRIQQQKVGGDKSEGSTSTVDVTFHRQPSWKNVDSDHQKNTAKWRKKQNPTQVRPNIPPPKKAVKKPLKPGEKLIRVKPFCDPDNAETTTWLTKKELKDAAFQPSHHWVEAGEGDLGNLYVEIIQCKNLPNCDTGVAGDFTDSFVAMVYEDVMVRTDVIPDELSPKFPPWMKRAYAFPIQHPASLLFLGVFDHDTIGVQTPIGRVVIDLSNFHPNTVYLLDYALQSNPHVNVQDHRGVITIRLRFEWHNEIKVMKRAFQPPPEYRINVPTHRTFQILKYVLRGELDMEKSTMASIKQYAYELLSYFDSYLFLVDAIARILLWRGHIIATIRKPKFLHRNSSDSMTLSLWFPLRSAVTFFMAINCVEHPSLIPSMFFYSIGLVMFTIMYSKSRYPSPWKQAKKVEDIMSGIIFGQEVHYVHIDPYEGHELALTLEELDQARIDRAKNLLFALKAFLLRLRQEKKKLDPYYHLTPTTVGRMSLFKLNILNFVDPTEYLHLILSTLCLYLRCIRNVITWKSYRYSFVLTMYCFFFGTIFLILPVERIIIWILRILVLTFLGPWMKLVDIFFVMPYYPPPCKDTRKLSIQEPDFDRFWDSPSYKVLAKRIHLAEESALKLQDMREHRFGAFMETVPVIDLSRYPSVPEPTSSARTFHPSSNTNISSSTSTLSSAASFGYGYLPKNCVKWRKFSGQKLRGDMIPQTVLDVTKDVKEKDL